jgi:hypothetical protein
VESEDLYDRLDHVAPEVNDQTGFDQGQEVPELLVRRNFDHKVETIEGLDEALDRGGVPHE